MSRILITGGAGYIGSVLAPLLLSQGHKVTVVDNFMYNQVHSLANCCNNPLFDIVNYDVRQFDYNLLKDYNVIIPLAALVGAPLCKKAVEVNEINYYVISRTVSHLKPDQLLIYPNTNSGYGSSGVEEVTEETLLNPISFYGV